MVLLGWTAIVVYIMFAIAWPGYQYFISHIIWKVFYEGDKDFFFFFY
jgi:hypothetical protein